MGFAKDSGYPQHSAQVPACSITTLGSHVESQRQSAVLDKGVTFGDEKAAMSGSGANRPVKPGGGLAWMLSCGASGGEGLGGGFGGFPVVGEEFLEPFNRMGADALQGALQGAKESG